MQSARQAVAEAAAAVLLAAQAWALAVTLSLDAAQKVAVALIYLWLELSGLRLAYSTAQGVASLLRRGLLAGLAAQAQDTAAVLIRRTLPRRLLPSQAAVAQGNGPAAGTYAAGLEAGGMQEEGEKGGEASAEALAGYERLPSRSGLALSEQAVAGSQLAAAAEGGAAAGGVEGAERLQEEMEPLLEGAPSAPDSAGAGVEAGGAGGQAGQGEGGLLPGGLGRAPSPPAHYRSPSAGSVASVDELLGTAVDKGGTVGGTTAGPVAPPTPAQPRMGPAAAAGFTSGPDADTGLSAAEPGSAGAQPYVTPLMSFLTNVMDQEAAEQGAARLAEEQAEQAATTAVTTATGEQAAPGGLPPASAAAEGLPFAGQGPAGMVEAQRTESGSSFKDSPLMVFLHAVADEDEAAAAAQPTPRWSPAGTPATGLLAVPAGAQAPEMSLRTAGVAALERGEEEAVEKAVPGSDAGEGTGFSKAAQAAPAQADRANTAFTRELAAAAADVVHSRQE